MGNDGFLQLDDPPHVIIKVGTTALSRRRLISRKPVSMSARSSASDPLLNIGDRPQYLVGI
jgi:hypothetical protein